MARIQILSFNPPSESHPCVLHARVVEGNVHVGMSIRFGIGWKIWYPTEIYRIEENPDGAENELILHLDADLDEYPLLQSDCFRYELLHVTWEPF